MNKEATLPHDPNVRLPAAVRAAAARSQEIFDAMKAASENQNGVTPESNEQTAEPAQEAAPQAEPAQEAPKPAAKATDDADDANWERRFNAMKGRWERSQAQVKDLSEQIANLHNVISTLKTQAQEQPLPELKAEKLITEEEARDYGEDFLKVVGKKAKEELAPIIKGYEAKIADLEKKLQNVNQHVAQDSQQKLLSTLDEKLPNWRDLNTNEDFISWLKLPDPFSGAIRHDMLKAAYAAGNASRVLAFFNGFLAEEAAVAPARSDSDEVPTEKVAKVPLAKLAAPGRAKTAAGNSAPAEKPIFTRAQIASFYADVASGKYRGRDTEKGKLEAQIFEAQREGRIR